MNGLLWFISLGLFAGLTLFSVVFRRVRAELTAARNHGIPRAVIAGSGARWVHSDPTLAAGPGLRARLAGSMPTVQAGIVATAATSIFVMAMCLLACVVLAVLGR